MRALVLSAVCSAVVGCSLVTDFDRSYKSPVTDGFFPGATYLPKPKAGEEADTSLCPAFCRAWTGCLAQPTVCHKVWAQGDSKEVDAITSGCVDACERQATVVQSQIDAVETPSQCSAIAARVKADLPDFDDACRQYLDFCADGCRNETVSAQAGPLLECFRSNRACTLKCSGQKVDQHACTDKKLDDDPDLTLCQAVDACWVEVDREAAGGAMPPDDMTSPD